MVEGTGLENRQRGDSFVGSNPTSSAISVLCSLNVAHFVALSRTKKIFFVCSRKQKALNSSRFCIKNIAWRNHRRFKDAQCYNKMMLA